MEYSTLEMERNREGYDEYRTEWQGIGITVRHCPCWLSCSGQEHVIQHIEILSDDRVALPITGTGYCSHFMHGDDALSDFENDPMAFVIWWIEEAAKSPDWQARRQLSLF